ncbi:hypothetical protein [Anatilimnocola floriformis]|uniref:hypothetical protein n=1 Tax=Anatilimnocola floriformis TaxID=2948575 RepID=UPI0020C3828B|nr:hypothetical protein [Anatilimnocola floriformis]
MPASSFLYGVFVALILSFAGLPSQHACADELIDRLLPAIAAPSLPNLRAAEQTWQSYDPATADVLSKYAMSLARAANNRDLPALELIESIPAGARSAGPLRRLHLWLALKASKDDVIHADMQTFIAQLKTRSANPPTATDLEDVQFLGKLVSYLELVANREGVLAPLQAKTWREALAALPAGWNADLRDTQTAMTATYREREQMLKENYALWRGDADEDYAAAQQKTAAIAVEVNAANDLVTAATAAYDTFLASARPQLQTLMATFNQLTVQRSTIPIPLAPTLPVRPQRDRDGNIDASEERSYKRALRQYDDDFEAYRKEKIVYDEIVGAIDAQIAMVNTAAMVLQNQDAGHQQNIQAKRTAVARLEKPKQLAERNELRVKNLIADRPAWDSPGTLATLRSLDSYVQINLAREVTRIQTARLK